MFNPIHFLWQQKKEKTRATCFSPEILRIGLPEATMGEPCPFPISGSESAGENEEEASLLIDLEF